MSVNYKEVHIKGQIEIDQPELLITELDFCGADSVWEQENVIIAAFNEDILNEQDIKDLCERYGLEYEIRVPEKINWNEEWERNFEPIYVDKILIRASFHKNLDKSDIDEEIIINPRMSFGTGHHETTSLMVKVMNDMNFGNKRVLDMGTGTGILAILACKKGAKEIVAVDVDEWSIDNAPDNFEINNCQNISLHKGNVSVLANFDKFDIILANINKNVLLADIGLYSEHLNEGGYLLLSGFYVEDDADIQNICKTSGLQFDLSMNQNKWSVLRFENR